MKALHLFELFNNTVVILLSLAYLYQIVYLITGFAYRKTDRSRPAKHQYRYALLISARNESAVIRELISSLKGQNYPKSLYDIFVLADNCTDDTAASAEQAGAIVYERNNRQEIGKGYALDYLYKQICRDYGENYYDGFMVFDADNIVDRNFIREMNRTFASHKFDAVTCYRNSKNFGSNWLSASYSIWFLHEARYVNYPRMLLGNSCMISGTGFLVSAKLMKENQGWPYHLLTEDIQFSVNCALQGKTIGYCNDAIVYDEQPTSFSQSWKQRLRWSKGFYQIIGKYLGGLFLGSLFSRKSKMSCYDVMMTVAPCMLLTIAVILLNVGLGLFSFSLPYYLRLLFQNVALRYLAFAVINFYLGMLIIGGLTIATEWDRINASKSDKLKYVWLFPLFLATYIPITLQALVSKVGWTPITHYSKEELAQKDKKAYANN